jgi:hypothetical protein
MGLSLMSEFLRMAKQHLFSFWNQLPTLFHRCFGENNGHPYNAIILYKSSAGMTTLDVHLDHDTVWLSQIQLAELFQRERSVITTHLRNVFAEG